MRLKRGSESHVASRRRVLRTHFGLLVIQKFYFREVEKENFQRLPGNILAFYTFWPIQAADWGSSRKQCSKWLNSADFGTHGLRGSKHLWAHFLHFCGPKYKFCLLLKPTYNGDLGSCDFIFCILAAWKGDFCRVVNPLHQGVLCYFELNSCFLVTWKRDFCWVLKPTVHGDAEQIGTVFLMNDVTSSFRWVLK